MWSSEGKGLRNKKQLSMINAAILGDKWFINQDILRIYDNIKRRRWTINDCSIFFTTLVSIFASLYLFDVNRLIHHLWNRIYKLLNWLKFLKLADFHFSLYFFDVFWKFIASKVNFMSLAISVLNEKICYLLVVFILNFTDRTKISFPSMFWFPLNKNIKEKSHLENDEIDNTIVQVPYDYNFCLWFPSNFWSLSW